MFSYTLLQKLKTNKLLINGNVNFDFSLHEQRRCQPVAGKLLGDTITVQIDEDPESGFETRVEQMYFRIMCDPREIIIPNI